MKFNGTRKQLENALRETERRGGQVGAICGEAAEEIAALRAILRNVLAVPVGPSLERIRDRHPTFHGVEWDAILEDPILFVNTHPIKVDN